MKNSTIIRNCYLFYKIILKNNMCNSRAELLEIGREIERSKSIFYE